MQIGGPPTSSDGGLPAGPPSAPPPGGGGQPGSDREIADMAAQQLHAATGQAQDPALKAALSQALAALHKYVMMDDKEHQAALGGKFSPRLMAQAHGRG